MTDGQKNRAVKNKRIARTISGSILLLLLIFFIIPFLSMSTLDSEEYRKKQSKQIVINFAQEKVKKFEQTRSEIIATEAAAKNPVNQPAANSAPPQEVAQPMDNPSVLPPAQSNPVVTAPSPTLPSLPSISDFFSKKPLADKPSQQALPDEVTGEDELAYSEEVGEKAPVSGQGTDPGSSNTAGTGRAETGGGSPNGGGRGEGGNGVAPAGYSYGNAAGLNQFSRFGRRLIKAPPKSARGALVGKRGTIYLKICVNSKGKVTEAAAIEQGTTTKDPTLLIAAEKVLRDYLFDEYDEPLQCGRFTYNLLP